MRVNTQNVRAFFAKICNSQNVLVGFILVGLIACSSPQANPAKNRYNSALNATSEAVRNSTNRTDARLVRTLAKSPKTCLAYRLPAKRPVWSKKFKFAIDTIFNQLKRDGRRNSQIHALAATYRHNAGPLIELAELQKHLDEHYAGSEITLRSVSPKKFYKRAHCGSQPTMLIVRNELQLYKSQIQIATLDGELNVEDMVFLQIVSNNTTYQ